MSRLDWHIYDGEKDIVCIRPDFSTDPALMVVLSAEDSISFCESIDELARTSQDADDFMARKQELLRSIYNGHTGEQAVAASD